MLRNVIYAFVYGREGAGKTRLAMTLAKDKNDIGIGYVTAESSGVTSLVTAGFNRKIPVEVLPPAGEDPFPHAVAALESFRKDPSIHTVVLDGCTVICGRAVDHLDDDGDGKIDWDSWSTILAGFRHIEAVCEKITRGDKAKGIPPKSVIMTAWEKAATYEPHPFQRGVQVLKDSGRPLLQGQAQTWLPGNVDIIARITSGMKKVEVAKTLDNGKKIKVFKEKFTSELQVKPTDEWLAKTRWDELPNPCPADLRLILDMVNGKKKIE